MKTLALEIITPESIAVQSEITSITLPGTVGSFQVLHNHAPIISTLEIGAITIVDSAGAKRVYACSGGVAEVLDNRVLVLANALEDADTIDEERAENALKRAKERLKNKEKDVDTDRAEMALKRAINRTKLRKTLEK